MSGNATTGANVATINCDAFNTAYFKKQSGAGIEIQILRNNLFTKAHGYGEKIEEITQYEQCIIRMDIEIAAQMSNVLNRIITEQFTKEEQLRYGINIENTEKA